MEGIGIIYVVAAYFVASDALSRLDKTGSQPMIGLVELGLLAAVGIAIVICYCIAHVSDNNRRIARYEKGQLDDAHDDR